MNRHFAPTGDDPLEAWETPLSRWGSREAWKGAAQPIVSSSATQSSASVGAADLQRLADIAAQYVAEIIANRRGLLRLRAELRELRRQKGYLESESPAAWLPSFLVQLSELQEEAASDGGSVNEASFKAAELFARMLPGAVDPPDTWLHPNNSRVVFEWQVDRRRILTISLGEDRTAYFAALLDENRISGAERLAQSLPRTIAAVLERLFEIDRQTA